jgi:hypothetical protein
MYCRFDLDGDMDMNVDMGTDINTDTDMDMEMDLSRYVLFIRVQILVPVVLHVSVLVNFLFFVHVHEQAL